MDKTGSEEENLEMKNTDDVERRRRSKLDLRKKRIWIWRTCRMPKKKKKGEAGELCIFETQVPGGYSVQVSIPLLESRVLETGV